MKVHLTRTTKFPQAKLLKVYELLTREVGPIEFQLTDKPMLFEKSGYNWDTFFHELHIFRATLNISDDDCIVCITELSNELNWFAAFDPNGSNSIFIHGADWENFVYSEPEYPIAFEVILNVLQRQLFPDFQKLEGHILIHDVPKGCINDMCIVKTDIGFKMRTADICLDCLQAYGNIVGEKVLEQTVEILETLRRGMMHSRVYLRQLSFEEKLPFSVAITKRKMGMTSQSFRKFLMMIDHFDSLVRTAVIMLAHLYHTKNTDVDNFFKVNGLTVKPSLGTWVQALAKLAQMKVDSNSISLPPNFTKKLKNVVSLENELKIVAIRNEKRGHGYIECTDEGYEQEVSGLLPILEEIERSLSALFERFNYYFVRRTTHKGKGKYSIDHTLLSGSNAAFLESSSIAEFKLADEVPEEKKCYLVTPDNKVWKCIDPHIKFEVCPECNHPRLLIADGEVFLDPFVGHRVVIN